MDPLIDLCPKCGLEVFVHKEAGLGTRFVCVEEGCRWSGTEPVVEDRKKYESEPETKR